MFMFRTRRNNYHDHHDDGQLKLNEELEAKRRWPRVSRLTVNTPDGKRHSYSKGSFPEPHMFHKCIELANKKHPNYATITITVVNPQLANDLRKDTNNLTVYKSLHIPKGSPLRKGKHRKPPTDPWWSTSKYRTDI